MDEQCQVDGVRIWAVVEMRCQLIRNAVMDQSVKGGSEQEASTLTIRKEV
jgi:hypothetical protein